jgi:hypothetical protein
MANAVPNDPLGDLRIVGDLIQLLAFRGGEESPEEGHTFGPIPAGMMALYRDSPGMDEDNLNLYRLDGSDWVVAVCPGSEGKIVRFPTDNRIAVPICQTGIFVLSDAPPGPTVAPVAQFSAAPTSGLTPLSVAFTDQSSNGPTNWQWDFGDGGISTEQHPVHVYKTPGAFTVTLVATNASGSDTLTKPDYITAIEAKEKVYLPLVLRSAP